MSEGIELHDKCEWCGMLLGEDHMAKLAGIILGKKSCGKCVQEYKIMGKKRWLEAEK